MIPAVEGHQASPLPSECPSRGFYGFFMDSSANLISRLVTRIELNELEVRTVYGDAPAVLVLVMCQCKFYVLW